MEHGRADVVGARARAGFEATFGSRPTAVGRAPGRVNLIGEHTDYNSGLCLPLALEHATYAAVAARADGGLRLASSTQSAIWTGRLDEVGPGRTEGWAAYAAGVLWAMREDGIEVPGLDVYVESTVPMGAGLSSSAALECAVAVAVVELVGLSLTPALRRRIVTQCVLAEQEVAGAPTGGMDQMVSMLATAGAALLIDFEDHSTTEVALSFESEDIALLVIDTGVTHALVDGSYADRRAECKEAAALLGLSSLRRADTAMVARLRDDRLRQRARHVVTEIVRVTDSVAAIADGDLTELGNLFNASHASLRDDFQVSCLELDAAVSHAAAAGAFGARMTGGGFGGSAIALVPRKRIEHVAAEIDAAFRHEQWSPPTYLLATPASGARCV